MNVDDQQILAHLDQWAGLSHKQALHGGPRGAMAPTWVGDEDRRRLAAYTVLGAYLRNVSRVLLDGTREDVSARREYGDPSLIVARVAGAILGDTQQIRVPGGDMQPDDRLSIPEPPAEPDGDDPIEARIYDARLNRWTTAVEDAFNEWEAAWDAWPALSRQREALTDWWDAEQMGAKVLEWNRLAVGLGDAVLELRVSARHDRPLVSIHDPGFYFPVLDDRPSDFPSAVHLAWEVKVDDEKWVRRRTYRLVDIRELGESTPRRYPWAPEDESWTTCLLSDGWWSIDRVTRTGLADLGDDAALWETNEDGVEVRDLDLRLDFVPVVHLPNTPSDQSHWGESILTPLAQLFDDLQQSDTDMDHAAGLAAVPLIATSGTTARLRDDFEVKPGATISLGENGNLNVLSMADALPVLQDHIDALLSRISVNGRVSADVIGRVDSSESTSGIAMKLSFGPFIQLVNELRMTRILKNSLVLKFATRMLQASGVLEPGQLPTPELTLGSFLPTDVTAVAQDVALLLNAHAISRQTGLDMLVEGGVKVPEMPSELDRIRAEDTAGANMAATATGSSQVAADWLGVDLGEDPTDIASGFPFGGGDQ